MRQIFKDILLRLKYKDFVGKELCLDFCVRLPLLLKKNPRDTWENLFFEALTNPAELRRRYIEELRFDAHVRKGWRKN